MKYYCVTAIIALCLLISPLLLQKHAVTRAQITTVHYPTTTDCSQLAQMTDQAMTKAQQQKAHWCDQQQAAMDWQAVYGQLSPQERLKAIVYEPI